MSRWFRKAPPPRIPTGQRVYAIGDVHGRLDLLESLLGQIAEDNAARPPADVILVMLGDLVDRGPDSRKVVTLARAGVAWAEMITLMGNHEAVMLDTLDGNTAILDRWLTFGGRETLTSWGVPQETLDHRDLDEILLASQAAVTPGELAWLRQLPKSLRLGDYYFVHAGIRPNVALDCQSDEDRLWIREEFLESKRTFGAIIVHGHSISPSIVERANRIGIDTGAYATDRLTAVGLEEDSRWFLSTDAAARREAVSVWKAEVPKRRIARGWQIGAPTL